MSGKVNGKISEKVSEKLREKACGMRRFSPFSIRRPELCLLGNLGKAIACSPSYVGRETLKIRK